MNFADTTHGVRLTYPGDWEERTFIRPRGTIVLLEIPNKQAGKMPPTFSLVAQDADESVSAADLPEMEQRLIEKGQKQIGDFHVVERSDTTLGGEPARLVIYSGRKFGISLQVMNIITTHAGRGYAAAYMADPQAFDEGRAEVDKVVQSVEFTR